MVGLIVCGVVLLCFCPMFSLHAKRRRALRLLDLGDSVDAQRWKKHVRLNSSFSDAAALCLAGSFLPVGLVSGGYQGGLEAPHHLAIPATILMLSALCASFVAIWHSKKSGDLEPDLGLPKGYRWITKKTAHRATPQEMNQAGDATVGSPRVTAWQIIASAFLSLICVLLALILFQLRELRPVTWAEIEKVRSSASDEAEAYAAYQSLLKRIPLVEDQSVTSEVTVSNLDEINNIDVEVSNSSPVEVEIKNIHPLPVEIDR